MSALSGMKEISDYVRRSESTILQWIRDLDFPAKKIGGVWESDKKMIDDWRSNQIINGSKQEKSKKPVPKIQGKIKKKSHQKSPQK